MASGLRLASVFFRKSGSEKEAKGKLLMTSPLLAGHRCPSRCSVQVTLSDIINTASRETPVKGVYAEVSDRDRLAMGGFASISCH